MRGLGCRWVDLMSRSPARCAGAGGHSCLGDPRDGLGWGVALSPFCSVNSFREPTSCQALIWTLLGLESLKLPPFPAPRIHMELWSHMKSSLTFSNTFSCSYATENPYVEKGFLSWPYSAIWGSVFRKEGRSQVPEPYRWDTAALIQWATGPSQPCRCCSCSVAQSHLTLCDPHGLQHSRLLGPPLSPGFCSNSCPSGQ